MTHTCTTCNESMVQTHTSEDNRGRTWIHYKCRVCHRTKKICIN